ncbi:DNRLRE domain-containing protein [[Clostridium] symbiosum]|uniref:DNRLRE domain-containing protein n=1 Tax=Clostridium symbiosum TaxID=1512 RepID=UPI0034A19F74
MATTTVNAFWDTWINNGMNTAGYNDAALKVYGKYYLAVLQFNIPALSDITIQSAKLRVYCIKSGRRVTMTARSYEVNERLPNNTTYASFEKYINAGYVESQGNYYLSEYNQDYNTWIEIDITNLIIGALGKNNFTLSLNTDGTSGASGQECKISSIEGGNTASIVINYSYAAPFAPTLLYPLGDILENTGNIRFQWRYNGGVSSGQAKYELGWKMQSSTTWNTVTVTSANQYRDMDAAAFSNGVVEWRVRTYNARDMVSDYTQSQFFVVGKPPNPLISNVKNNAITEITWEADKSEEVAAQIQIKQSNVLIFDSGKVSGGIDDVFTPDIILSDGQYTVFLRISNLFDMWSNWISRTFTVGGTKPTKPVVRVYDQGDFITLEYSGNATRYFIYRSEDEGEFIPIAQTTELKYEDFTMCSGKRYRYVIRAYTQSYTDSDIVEVYISYRGTYIAPIDNRKKRIRLLLSEDEEMELGIGTDREKSLITYTGRNYPVMEVGDLITRTINLSGFLYTADANYLERLVSMGKTFCIRNKEHRMFCSAGSLSMSQKLFFGGYNVGITMTEIDYEEKVRFDNV